MAKESSSFDDALNRLTGLLNKPPTTPPAGSGGVGNPPAPGGVAPKPSPPIIPTDQKAEIATQVYYSMGLPLITRSQLSEMELDLPKLIDLLKGMNSRPTLKSDLEQLIGAIKQSSGGSERDAADLSRANALAEMIGNDAFGEGERVIPLIGVAIGIFMAGYTVARNWGH